MSYLSYKTHFLSKTYQHLFRLLRRSSFTRRLVAAMLAFLLLVSGVLVLFRPSPARAAWFDDSYAYRQQITFTHNADLTSASMRLTISNTNTLVTAGKMRSDCFDSRFTDSNGKVLRFNLVSGCNSASTVYDVVFPTVINGSNLAYFYYGKPSATSASDSTVPAGTTPSGSPSFASEEKGPSPVLYFNFDEGYGTTAHNNGTCGTACNGTLTGMASPATDSSGWTASGKFTKALNFDGTNDNVNISNGLTQLTTEMTVSAWIKPNLKDTSDRIIIQSNRFLFRADDDTGAGKVCIFTMTSVGIEAAGNPRVCTTSGLATGTWYFVTATFDVNGGSNNKKIYVNGVLNNSGTVSYNLSGTWDATTDIGGTNFNGAIDEVRVYNYALTAAQIKTNYANRGGSDQVSSSFGYDDPSSLSSGLAGYWKIDEGTGRSVADSSGNGNTGTLNGGWAYQLPLTVNSGSTLTNYQVSFTMNTQSLVTDGKMQNDCDDARFYDSDNSTPLNYWIKTGTCNTPATIFWIKISSIPNPSKTIYMYYGNPSAAIGQSGTNTFDFFDDFSGNLSKWTTNVGTGASVSIVTGFLRISITNADPGGTSGIQTNLNVMNSNQALDMKLAVSTRPSIQNDYPEVGRDSDWGIRTSSNFEMFESGESPNDVTFYNTSSHIIGSKWGTSFIDVSIKYGASTISYSDSAGNSGSGYAYSSLALPSKLYFKNTVNINDNSNFDIDDVRIRQYASSEPTVTPGTESVYTVNWTAGKFAKALNFDGVSNYISVPASAAFDNQKLTIASWVYSTNFNQNGFIFEKTTNGSVNTQYSCFFSGTNIYFRTYNNSSTQNDLTLAWSGWVTNSAWNHIACVYDGVKKYIYVNGVLAASSAYTQTLATNAAGTSFIGAYGNGGGYFFNGKIDDLRVYNRALSPSETASLYDWGPGPVGHWKFDERTGTSAFDSSGNANTGTLTGGPQWTTGKFGSGLSFDGTDDYVDIGNNSSLNPTNITISAWIYPTELNVSKRYFIINNWDTNNKRSYLIGIDDNKLWGLLSSNGTSSPNAYSPSTLSINNWYHIAITYAGSNGKIYIDGVDSGTITVSGDLYTPTTMNVLIGKYSTEPFKGYLDDLRIYNYARSPKQLISDMNAGHPAVGSPVGSAIGHWNFDEGYGTIAHSSGSCATCSGTLTGMDTPATYGSGWTNNGKFGKALNFDGVNDYIDLGNAAGLKPANVTATAWIKTTSTSKMIVAYNLTSSYYGYDMYITGGKLRVEADGALLGVQSFTGTRTINDNLWHQVTLTYDGATLKGYVDGVLDSSNAYAGGDLQYDTGTESILVGKRGSSYYFSGTIDNVNIYNYALNAQEIKTEYNQGKAAVWGAASTNPDNRTASSSAARAYCPPGDAGTNCAGTGVLNASPVAHWTFDENTGAAANDSSGNGNTDTASFIPAGWTYQRPLSITNSGSTLTNYQVSFTIDTLALYNAGKMQIDCDDARFYDSDNTSLNYWIESGCNTTATIFWIKIPSIPNPGKTIYMYYGNPSAAIGQSGTNTFDFFDDFSAGTSNLSEVDPNSRIVQDRTTDYRLEWTALDRNENAYVYKSIPSASDFYVQFNTSNANAVGNGIAEIGFADGVGTPGEGAGNQITNGLYSEYWGSSLTIMHATSGTNARSSSISISQSTTYWVKFYRIGTTVTLRAYTDAAMTSEVASSPVTYTDSSPVAFTYFYPITSYNSNQSGNSVTGWSDSFILRKYASTEPQVTAGGERSASTLLWTRGKIGSALNFNGVNNYLSLPASSAFDSQRITIAGWLYSTNFNQNGFIFEKTTNGNVNTQYSCFFNNGSNIYFRTYNSSGTQNNLTLAWTGLVSNNAWNHIACIYDGANKYIYVNGKLATSAAYNQTLATNPAGTSFIGAYGSGVGYFFNGKIDDLRIYNYARTPAQIAWDYNRGAPVGWWKFDECQGTVAHDASGNAYNGTITIGATGSQTSVGTCGTPASSWGDGSVGKFNSSLALDGTDDYTATGNTVLNSTDSTTYQVVSWGDWVLASSSATSKTILHKNKEFKLTTDANSKAVCSVDISAGAGFSATTAVSSTTVPVGNWTHVLCTYDGTNIRVYINGLLETTSSTLSGSITSTNTTALSIGRDPAPSGYFQGLIDDARIYNYALTPSQIRTLYNENSAIRFGPQTGSP